MLFVRWLTPSMHIVIHSVIHWFSQWTRHSGHQRVAESFIHSDACMHSFDLAVINSVKHLRFERIFLWALNGHSISYGCWLVFETSAPAPSTTDTLVSQGIPSFPPGLAIQGSRIHPRSRDLYRHSRSVCTAPAQLRIFSNWAEWCQVMQSDGRILKRTI